MCAGCSSRAEGRPADGRTVDSIGISGSRIWEIGSSPDHVGGVVKRSPVFGSSVSDG